MVKRLASISTAGSCSHLEPVPRVYHRSVKRRRRSQASSLRGANFGKLRAAGRRSPLTIPGRVGEVGVRVDAAEFAGLDQ